MVTAARSAPITQVDVPTLVDNIREFNKQAAKIVNAPLAGRQSADLLSLRNELGGALDELDATVKALRSAVTRVAATPSGASSSSVSDPAALVLDSTEAMVQKGQLVTAAEFQELMGWTSRQAVWKAVDSRRVFCLEYKAQRYFPAFYADASYDRRHLEAVTKILGDLPGGAKLQFFLTRKGSLGGATPLQALAAGRVAKVRDIAAAFAEVPSEV
jgi:hypothetical protein